MGSSAARVMRKGVPGTRTAHQARLGSSSQHLLENTALQLCRAHLALGSVMMLLPHKAADQNRVSWAPCMQGMGFILGKSRDHKWERNAPLERVK